MKDAAKNAVDNVEAIFARQEVGFDFDLSEYLQCILIIFSNA